MIDRVVQYPHRYRAVPVAGQENVFDFVPVPGTVTSEGTPLNKATLLSDKTVNQLRDRGFLLPQSDPTVNDAIRLFMQNDIANMTRVTFLTTDLSGQKCAGIMLELYIGEICTYKFYTSSTGFSDVLVPLGFTYTVKVAADPISYNPDNFLTFEAKSTAMEIDLLPILGADPVEITKSGVYRFSYLYASADVFLVGGGGGGCRGGGGGGRTCTARNLTLDVNTDYTINIGAGGTGGNSNTVGAGGTTTAFGYSASGGGFTTNWSGGAGGSGGGGGSFRGGGGGSNGGNGGVGTAKNGSVYGQAGIGQGTSTRAFSEDSGALYAGGGGGAGSNSGGYAGGGGSGGGGSGSTATGGNATFYGGGGGGGQDGVGGSGYQGIVLVRRATT